MKLCSTVVMTPLAKAAPTWPDGPTPAATLRTLDDPLYLHFKSYLLDLLHPLYDLVFCLKVAATSVAARLHPHGHWPHPAATLQLPSVLGRYLVPPCVSALRGRVAALYSASLFLACVCVCSGDKACVCVCSGDKACVCVCVLG